jgi:phosphatidylglycerol:prolipoprotein diacylglycerol transferase
MLQEVFRIGNFPIYGYGLMLVIGFLAAVELAKFLAKRSKIDPEIFVNAALIALIAGVAGSRLSHVIENWSDYNRPELNFFQNAFNAINIRQGGLTFYGGLILAFPIVLYYGLRKRIPLRLGMDIVAPCITLGLAFGRIGCFLNGCCYGAECNLPWAVEFPYHSSAYIDQVYRKEITPPPQLLVRDGDSQRLITKDELRTGRAEITVLDENAKPVKTRVPLDAQLASLAKEQHSLDLHPAQLYSAFNSFLITALLVAFFTLKPSPGRVMALMLMLEGTTRFLLELLRAEPPVLGRMSLSMIIALILVAIGALMWFAFADRSRASAIAPVPVAA